MTSARLWIAAAVIVAVPLVAYPLAVGADGARFPSRDDCVRRAPPGSTEQLDLVFGRRDTPGQAERLLARVRTVGYVDAGEMVAFLGEAQARFQEAGQASPADGGFRFLRKRSGLVLHAHRNGWDILTRHAGLGFEFSVWQQFWRLLGVDQFQIREDGQPQSVKIFEAQSSALTLALLVDTTGSMASVLPHVKNAVAQLISAMKPEDSLGLYSFRNRLTVLQPITRTRSPGL